MYLIGRHSQVPDVCDCSRVTVCVTGALLMAGMGMWFMLLYKKVLRQLEFVKSKALQDKRLIHYLQYEVAKFKVLEDVKMKDLGGTL